MAQAVQIAQQVLTLFALIGAIWSAFEFVKAILETKKTNRLNQLNSWRKAEIHHLLHKSRLFLSIDEITDNLRSLSFDTSIDVKKEELTSTVVRLILLEMLEAGTIQQLWGDHFGIKQNDPAVANAEREVLTWTLINQALRLISIAPGSLTTEALYEALFREPSDKDSMPPYTFALIISKLSAMEVATVNADGKWTMSPRSKELENR